MAGLDMDAYRIARPYLVQHVRHYLCGLDGLEAWAPEARVVVFDPDADVVVISTPDLRCTVSGSNEVIWRETKTSGRVPRDLEQAMLRYPAFALNVALLTADVPARHPGAHAELEVLTPNDSDVFHVSTSDGQLVVLAQRIVAEIARRYAADLAFDRRPTAACATCPTNRWCDPPSAPREAADEPRTAVDDNEFTEMDDPF